MIVRVLGRGQWDLPESSLEQLNALDDVVNQAVKDGDQDQLSAQLQKIFDQISQSGTEVADDQLCESQLIVPGPDATLDEVAELLAEDGRGSGLIPD